MNILITGGAGYIGTALTQSLLQRGYTVTVYDSLSTGQIELVDSRATVVEGDIMDSPSLTTALSAQQYDVVIHLAALKSVGDGEENPAEYYRINVQGTVNVLEAMRKNNIPVIMFSSTAAVYKETGKKIYSETDTTDPQSVYGSTKLMCEQLIQQYVRMGYVSNHTIFRYFNLAGDVGLGFYDTQAQNVFPRLARAYSEGVTFRVFGDDYDTSDGTGVRDYIHIDDLMTAHHCALRYNFSGICNLGTAQGTSVGQLIKAFEDCTGQPLPRTVAPRRIGDPATILASCAKANQELHWKPVKTLEDMVSSTVNVYGAK